MEEKKELVLSGTQKFQVDIVNLVDKGLEESGAKFTDYGRTCVINAMASFITVCRNNDYDLKKIDQTTLKIALQNVGFTELNFAATPAEAYFDIRKNDGGYSVSIKPQGAGNEKLTRKFGVNLKDLKSAILVREGDNYTLPGFDGEKMTPFKWQPKSLDAKVIMVVYPVVKNDGTLEYLMATRESIKPNLIAQIRQSNLYSFKKIENGKSVIDVEKRDQFYEEVNREFEKLTVDQILANEKWRKQLTPTYTSGGSVEAMVIRKMKNNALKNYPREFDNSYEAEAYKDMWEDKDDSLNIQKEKAIDVDVVQKVEKEITEEPKDESAPQDFNVSVDGEIVKEEPETVKEEVKPNNNPAPKDDYEDLF